MTTPDDINALAASAYAAGTDPLRWAEGLIGNLIEVHATVEMARQQNPRAYPGYCIEMTLEALARRIVGELMDAGWTAPGGTP